MSRLNPNARVKTDTCDGLDRPRAWRMRPAPLTHTGFDPRRGLQDGGELRQAAGAVTAAAGLGTQLLLVERAGLISTASKENFSRRQSNVVAARVTAAATPAARASVVGWSAGCSASA
jgi:hypothetical protein